MKGTKLSLPLCTTLTKSLVRLILQLGFEAIDLGDNRLKALDGALILSADDFLNDPFKHDAKEAGLVRRGRHFGRYGAFGKPGPGGLPVFVANLTNKSSQLVRK